MSAIQADYRTQKHIPSRKCYQLIMEVAEEDYPEVCRVLGYPKTGENTFVGIALLDKGVLKGENSPQLEKTEGERIRTRAHVYPKNEMFCAFVAEQPAYIGYGNTEKEATQFIYNYCGITSRSEFAKNLDAQIKFKALLAKYESWKLENSYKDNLGRI